MLFCKTINFSIFSVLSIPIEVTLIYGGYFAAMCGVCLNRYSISAKQSKLNRVYNDLHNEVQWVLVSIPVLISSLLETGLCLNYILSLIVCSFSNFDHNRGFGYQWRLFFGYLPGILFKNPNFKLCSCILAFILFLLFIL